MTKAILALLIGGLAVALIAGMSTGARRTAAAGKNTPTRGKEDSMAITSMGLVKVTMLSLLVLAAGALIAVSVSTAIFTSSTTVGSNTFNTGTLTLGTSPTSAVWTAVTAGAPGDRVTGSLTVSNSGSLPFRYAVSGSNTNSTLAAAMNLRIGLQTGGACDFPYFNTDGTTTTLTDDTQLFSGAMNTTNLIGNPNQGSQSGDRTLAASASEVLCFSAVLPLSAGNTLQGLSNTITFTFDGEQTANNP